MRIENYFDLSGNNGYSGLFFACGSFGIVDGDAEYVKEEKAGKSTYTFQNESIRLQAEFEVVDGICVRRDSLENFSEHTVEINDLVSRFCLDGNDYDVYTQYNAWQHESTGGWQRLVTQIRAEACGMRGCDGAAPVMGFHNRSTGKNTVFHLLPNAQWQMTAKKFPKNEKEIVILEGGFCSSGLRFRLEPGEKIDLPELIFFSAESKTDLDAYKLHQYFNKRYPRKSLPIIYNSWLHCFDNLDPDDLIRQADRAGEMGFEAFMIDAGWFGNGDSWSSSVGDWEENTISGPRGRLGEISRRVRKNGMIFGLWFEPERASEKSRAVAEHPEYYMGTGKNRVLNFSNPETVSYMADIVSAQIKKYDIGWVKFDFNTSLTVDPAGCGFYRYFQGQRRFVELLKEQFPELYISNCASGGYRMDLYQAQFTDSFWLSDNQGPFGEIDIVKGTLKRMPTGCIERWNIQKYADGFPRYGHKETVGLLLNCNNATWDSIVAVHPSLAEGIVQGGPMGFSCSLTDFPPIYQKQWSDVIAKYKEDREFYRNATARILVDSDQISVIEYADENFDQCILQIFTKTVAARDLILYPSVNKNVKYQSPDGEIDGSDLAENGIHVTSLKDNSCQTIILRKQ